MSSPRLSHVMGAIGADVYSNVPGERCTRNDCDCHGMGLNARWKGMCKECWREIKVGDCIQPSKRAGVGFVHTVCPERARGVLAECHNVMDPMMDDVAPGEHAPGPMVRVPKLKKQATEEQLQILDYVPSPGHRIRISAVAGAGKTTTCVLLARRIHRRQPDARIAYIVFNEKARHEAMARFGNDVHVMTSHSLARCRAWPMPLAVASGYPKIEDVVQSLGLSELAFLELTKREASATSDEGRKKQQHKQQRIARREARYILKTLDNFLASDAPEISIDHVFWKAVQAKRYVSQMYVEKAGIAYIRMNDPNDNIWKQTHDGYLKRFQLSADDALNLGPHVQPRCRTCVNVTMRKIHGSPGRFTSFYVCDGCQAKENADRLDGFHYIIVDEAQDFTPCQAAAFFNQINYGAIVYMVGDARQRMYRWRGAGDSFEMASVDQVFTLTDSFRFGPAVAETANKVLDYACAGAGGPRVKGRGDPASQVLTPDSALPTSANVGRVAPTAVVITRSNKGMFEELVRRVVRPHGGGVSRSWDFIDKKMAEYLLKDDGFKPYLKLRKEEGSVRLKGEEFETWEELVEFIDETEDAQMRTYADVVEQYGDEVPDLVASLRAARVDDWKSADVAFITTHKAKGLEFDLVELGSDFRLPVEDTGELVNSERVRKPYWQEELNILYVAITRANLWLRLSLEVVSFLQIFGALPTAPPQPPQFTEDRYDELLRIRLGHEAAWKIFEQEVDGNAAFVVDATSVPFPRGPDGNILAIEDGCSTEGAQRNITEALLRFHPDKFLARYAARIPPEELSTSSRLRHCLAEVTRALLQMRRDYTVGGEVSATPGPPRNECPVCMEQYGPLDGSALLLTVCCRKQRMCYTCYAELVQHQQDARCCPFCRSPNFEARPWQKPQAGGRQARSRSPRRQIAAT